MTGNSSTRIGLLLFPALAVIASTAPAQEKLHNPKYQAGKAYDFEMSQNMVMDMTAMGAAAGQPVGKTTIDMMMGMELASSKHEVEGQTAIATSFSKVKMDMDMGVMQMSYDSSDPASANSPLAAGFKPMMAMEFVTIVNDETGEVVEIQGIENLQGVQALDPEQLKQMSNPSAQLGIPKEGVSVGDEWEHEVDMPMGQQVGKVSVKMKMKYEKDEEVEGKTLALVTFTGTLNMEAGEAGAQMMKIEDAKLEGNMRFDKKNQMMADGVTKGKFNMSMPNPAGGGANIAIPLDFVQKYDLTEKVAQ